MRSITEIKASITAAFMGNETLASLYGFETGASFDDVFSSKLSLESILFYIVASAIFVLESMFDKLKSDVDSALAERLTHNRRWYANEAKKFQFGDTINPETGKYDIVDESKTIVDHAAVEEAENRLILKVATTDGEDLAPLAPKQLTAFREYMQAVKDAGIKIEIITSVGDALRLVIDILYNPLVLDETGSALDGSGEPVKAAIRNYIKNLPFNGEFSTAALTDALQSANGVVIPTVKSVEYSYAAYPWMPINVRVKPNSGYMVVADENMTVNCEPYGLSQELRVKKRNS